MKRMLASVLALAVTSLSVSLTLIPGAYASAPVAPADLATARTIAPDDLARLHPHLVTAPPVTSWTVKPGQSLSVIAGKAYGSTSLWPALWWINKAAIRNPDVISSGQVIKLSAWHPSVAWLSRTALHAIPAPPPPHVTVVSYSRGSGRAGSTAIYSARRVTYPSAASGTYRGSGSMEQCIISRESGGNSQVMNSSGHYGLYQFSESTWVGSGGSASSFGHASVAQQRQVFSNAVAARGYSDWRAYDGC